MNDLTDSQKYDAIKKKYLGDRIIEAERLKKIPTLQFEMTQDFYKATIKGGNYCFKEPYANQLVDQLTNCPTQPPSPNCPVKIELLNRPGKYHVHWCPFGDHITLRDHYIDIIDAFEDQLEPDWVRDEFKDAAFLEKCRACCTIQFLSILALGFIGFLRSQVLKKAIVKQALYLNQTFKHVSKKELCLL